MVLSLAESPRIFTDVRILAFFFRRMTIFYRALQMISRLTDDSGGEATAYARATYDEGI